MSRSYQKNPAGKICSVKRRNQKRWKRWMSRKRRAAERDPRFIEQDYTTFFDKSVDAYYDSPSDGWRWYGRDCDPKLLRK